MKMVGPDISLDNILEWAVHLFFLVYNGLSEQSSGWDPVK